MTEKKQKLQLHYTLEEETPIHSLGPTSLIILRNIEQEVRQGSYPWQVHKQIPNRIFPRHICRAHFSFILRGRLVKQRELTLDMRDFSSGGIWESEKRHRFMSSRIWRLCQSSLESVGFSGCSEMRFSRWLTRSLIDMEERRPGTIISSHFPTSFRFSCSTVGVLMAVSKDKKNLCLEHCTISPRADHLSDETNLILAKVFHEGRIPSVRQLHLLYHSLGKKTEQQMVN
ncbi:GTP-binding protein [Striga asiatica]|uniref:GTP-binding protein n=1 Tax=Striga asiatica TaxID=4170 RepID=A0A5A7R9I6_STRAF|nr:GTP-binding protein [Striga asiatica]